MGGCRCSDRARARYSRRLSGPLLDRFDLRIEVRPPPATLLLARDGEESTAAVAARVAAARACARERGVVANAALPSGRLDQVAPLTVEARRVLRTALERNELTARGLDRVRRVAVTIADLLGSERIDGEVVRAALALRPRPASVLGIAS